MMMMTHQKSKPPNLPSFLPSFQAPNRKAPPKSSQLCEVRKKSKLENPREKKCDPRSRPQRASDHFRCCFRLDIRNEDEWWSRPKWSPNLFRESARSVRTRRRQQRANERATKRRRERPTCPFFLDENSRKPKPASRALSIQMELHPSIARLHPSTTRKTDLLVLLGWKIPQTQTKKPGIVHPSRTSSIYYTFPSVDESNGNPANDDAEDQPTRSSWMKTATKPNQEDSVVSCSSKWNFIHLVHISIRPWTDRPRVQRKQKTL